MRPMLLMLALAGIACGPAMAASDKVPPVPMPKSLVCTVGRVLDGDTFTCRDARKVRLWGGNSPELPHFGRPGEPGANAARASLQQLILGKEVTCEPRGGSFDRVVALCRLPDGRDVMAEQIKAGMAQDCRKYSGGAYRALETPDVFRNRRMCGG